MKIKNVFLLFSLSIVFPVLYAKDKTFEKVIAEKSNEAKEKFAEKIEEGKSVIHSKLFKKEPSARDIFDKLVAGEKLTFEDKVLVGQYSAGSMVGLAFFYFVPSGFIVKFAAGALGGCGAFYVEEKLKNTEFVQKQLQKHFKQ